MKKLWVTMSKMLKLLPPVAGKSYEASDRFRIEVVWARAEEEREEEDAEGRAFRERSDDDMIITITLEGVILQQEAAMMERIFDAVLVTQFTKLIVNLAEVLTISQRGIEALLGFRNKSKKRGCELEIHGIHPIVRRTLEERGLNKAFIIR